jgi:hypothetical protein
MRGSVQLHTPAVLPPWEKSKYQFSRKLGRRLEVKFRYLLLTVGNELYLAGLNVNV